MQHIMLRLSVSCTNITVRTNDLEDISCFNVIARLTDNGKKTFTGLALKLDTPESVSENTDKAFFSRFYIY